MCFSSVCSIFFCSGGFHIYKFKICFGLQHVPQNLRGFSNVYKACEIRPHMKKSLKIENVFKFSISFLMTLSGIDCQVTKRLFSFAEVFYLNILLLFLRSKRKFYSFNSIFIISR